MYPLRLGFDRYPHKFHFLSYTTCLSNMNMSTVQLANIIAIDIVGAGLVRFETRIFIEINRGAVHAAVWTLTFSNEVYLIFLGALNNLCHWVVARIAVLHLLPAGFDHINFSHINALPIVHIQMLFWLYICWSVLSY